MTRVFLTAERTRPSPKLPHGHRQVACASCGAALALILLLGTPRSYGQALAVGNASGPAGTAADVTVTFTEGPDAISTLQFDLTFPSALAYFSVTTGSAASAAGKDASGNAVAGGTRVLIFGLNQNAIPSGAVATVRLNIAAGTPAGAITIGVTGITAADPSGNGVPLSGTPGTITVTATGGDTTPPVISNVASTSITHSGARITWTTDEPADTQVEYGTSTGYGNSTTTNTSKVTSHSQSLTGLTASTLYHYRVKSKDAAGNLATSDDCTFTTATMTDTTPPVISAVRASTITNSSASILWTTNESSDSQVEYGTTIPYDRSTAVNSLKVTSHSQSLTGLSRGTLYYYRVKSRDAAGNLATSGDYTFTTTATADTTPPVISGVTAINITPRSATMVWTTNEDSDSQIEFGTTTSYGSSSILDTSMVTAHTLSLNSLSGNTLYHYRVRSRDAAGNLAVSRDYAIATADSPDRTPPLITGITVTALTQSMVRISWNTDEVSDSEVEYGATTSYGSSTPLSLSMVTAHIQTLLGLGPKTLYHFRVKSRDGGGNLATTGDLTFTTPESGGPNDTQRTLFCPRPFDSQDDKYIGVAIVNLDGSPATITFTASDAAGAKIDGENITNPATRALDPGRQLPIVDAELFGAGLSAHEGGWIKIESNVRNIAGFFMIFDSGLNVLDGATISISPMTSFIFSEVEAEGFTRIAIDNPNTEAAKITFELVGSGGNVLASETRDIQGYGSLTAELFEDLFQEANPSADGYVRVTSDRPVVPFQLMGEALTYVSALNGQDATATTTTLYCPQYAVGGPWRSALSVVNLDSTAGLVNFRFIPEDPSQTGATEVVPIPAHGKIYIDDPSFFRFLSVGQPGLVSQGYVEIVSDGIRSAGSVVFGDVERSTFSSALPLVSTLERSLIFSHVASNDTYFTGLAIVNPNETDTLAAVSLYSADGKLEASATQLIPAKGRVSRLLTEYFPALAGQNRASGYIKVSADKGVASFALFGTHLLSVLSAIPAQPAP